MDSSSTPKPYALLDLKLETALQKTHAFCAISTSTIAKRRFVQRELFSPLASVFTASLRSSFYAKFGTYTKSGHLPIIQ